MSTHMVASTDQTNQTNETNPEKLYYGTFEVDLLKIASKRNREQFVPLRIDYAAPQRASATKAKAPPAKAPPADQPAINNRSGSPP